MRPISIVATLCAVKRALIFVACAGLLWACGPTHSARLPLALAAVDAPYEPALDDDLALLRESYDSHLVGDGDRTELRAPLAMEYARRIDESLASDDLNAAFRSFGALLSLWKTPEFGSPDLRAFSPQAQAIRARFAKSGGDIETIAALVALTQMKPGESDRYVVEIEEIFAFTDDLAVSRSGSEAVGARPIEALELVVTLMPTRWVVDRLISLYRARQATIASSFRRKSADMDFLRVHGPGVLSTARNIVAVLTITGRVHEALGAISDITGIGDDATLRKHLQTALNSNQAPAWVLLASLFRDDEQIPGVALALCQEAIRREPKEALGYIAASDTAARLNNVLLAIRYLEVGLAIEPDDQDASSNLASLYEERVSELAYSDRPNAALAQLKTFEKFYATSSRRFDKPLEPDLASAYAVMGRGLVSLGDLVEARKYLNRSLKLRPNLHSFEILGTIALRQGHFEQATRFFQKALGVHSQTNDDQFERTRLLRLIAESLTGDGKRDLAQSTLRSALVAWERLLSEYELAPGTLAEVLIELGKTYFELGKREAALEYFFRALDRMPDNNATHADLVSFLIVRGGYDAAYDVYLDAMGNRDVSEYFKTYMSMWILAEGKRLGREADHFAMQYLRSREGGLWTRSLARFAVGEMDRSQLEKQVNTRGRRAELMYYAAVLGKESDDPVASRELLEEVVKGSMVLFFEYELAIQRLRQLR